MLVQDSVGADFTYSLKSEIRFLTLTDFATDLEKSVIRTKHLLSPWSTNRVLGDFYGIVASVESVLNLEDIAQLTDTQPTDFNKVWFISWRVFPPIAHLFCRSNTGRLVPSTVRHERIDVDSGAIGTYWETPFLGKYNHVIRWTITNWANTLQ